ncbi:MAG TPA: DUF3187 family protein, partial [Gemmatimonadales bacterium]
MSRCALALALAVLPAPLSAQGLPPYASMNPMVQIRTGLASLPIAEPGRRWHFTVLTDYASNIEYADVPAVQYLMDAELLRIEMTAERSLGGRGFLLAQGSFQSAGDGFLDGFLNWYHDFTGFQVAARKLRPDNAFGYRIGLADGRSAEYRPSSGFLGDVRIGAGLRHSRHWQTAFSVTLPTSTGPRGFRKGVP